MKRIKELGMQGDITTNGTLLTEDLVDILVNIEWDHIISIDGSNAEINDYLRSPRGPSIK